MHNVEERVFPGVAKDEPADAAKSIYSADDHVFVDRCNKMNLLFAGDLFLSTQIPTGGDSGFLLFDDATMMLWRRRGGEWR